jgi:hypothetical protein
LFFQGCINLIEFSIDLPAYDEGQNKQAYINDDFPVLQ